MPSNAAFTLRPFADQGRGFQVHGTVWWSGFLVTITYQLDGELSALHLPSPTPAVQQQPDKKIIGPGSSAVAAPQRRDGLWEGTCFEGALAAAAAAVPAAAAASPAACSAALLAGHCHSCRVPV